MTTKTISQIFTYIKEEQLRQDKVINLIASENIASNNIIKAQASRLVNKYAEGYTGNRFYNGCQIIDSIESAAIENAKALFKCKYVNVQAHSGSNANLAAYMAVLKPNDKILSLNLKDGGHLTHGSKASKISDIFNFSHYSLDSNQKIDYDQVQEIAMKEKPQMIIAGYSSYSLMPNWQRFAKIAKKCGAYFLADMSHVSGIVAAKPHLSPVGYADIITSTTHKTLRGPRGAIILTNDANIAKKIDSSVFPGLQGGPFVNVIAAKAVAFAEALQPSFIVYINHMLHLAKVMCNKLIAENIDIVTGDTNTHLLLINLTKFNLCGNTVSHYLERAGIIVNKNTIPNDTKGPLATSGIRLGTAAIATLNMTAAQAVAVAGHIALIIKTLAKNENQIEAVVCEIREEVAKITTTLNINEQIQKS